MSSRHGEGSAEAVLGHKGQQCIANDISASLTAEILLLSLAFLHLLHLIEQKMHCFSQKEL